MKIQIDAKGQLHISRNGVLKPQFCPFDVANEATQAKCGDWCPLFGEPERYGLTAILADGTKVEPTTFCMQLCHSKFLEGEIADLRGTP